MFRNSALARFQTPFNLGHVAPVLLHLDFFLRTVLESQEIELSFLHSVLGSISTRDGGIEPQTQKRENSSALIILLTVNIGINSVS